jgi:glutamine synthetase
VRFAANRAARDGNLELMRRESIVFVGTSDLSGHFRGKSFPAADLPARSTRGVGLAPTNIFMSAFGPIQVTTFGTQGEVFLVPDSATRVFVPFEGSTAEHFFVGDIQTLEGTPWDFCPRQVLRRALERLRLRRASSCWRPSSRSSFTAAWRRIRRSPMSWMRFVVRERSAKLCWERCVRRA